MKCKFCEAEFEAQDSVCPVCGKDNAEPETVETVTQKETPVFEEAAVEEEPAALEDETVEAESVAAEKPKKNVWMYVAIAACAALAVLLAFVIWQSVADKLPADKQTTAATTESTAPIVYDSYDAPEAEVLAAANKVVATMGEHQLTNRMLQIFYWSEYYNFLDLYGNYLSYYGLDYTAPLNEQGVPQSEYSWEQYFVKVALDSWHRYQVLYLEAKKNGVEMDAEAKTALEQLPQTLADVAAEYGFESVDALLSADMGNGVTLDDYSKYMEVYYTGLQYYNYLHDGINPTREEVSAYFDENAETFSTNYGITKESGNLVNVRHILLQPEGAEQDSTTGYITATDEQWEACRQGAQALLDSWAAGEATEEAFGKLANENSLDGGSNTTGGLYEDVLKGRMVEAFDEWIFAEGRQSGDTGLVKTEFGYHIMYFVGAGDEAWYTYARPELISQLTGNAMQALMEASPIEIDDDAILLDSASLDDDPAPETTDSTETTGAVETTAATAATE